MGGFAGQRRCMLLFMFPTRSIAFMNLYLSCVFSAGAVLGTLVLPSFLPNVHVDDLLPITPSAATNTPPSKPVNLLFVGDIMLARGVEWKISQTNLDYPLSNIADYLSAPDLTIGNFEGTIREAPKQELDGFTFDTTPEIAKMVADAGVDFVSLSNNHSDNYGSSVVASTRNTIASLGMTPFGDPYDSKDFIGHTTVNGVSISFVGFHAFGEEPESIVDSIRTEKAAGNFVIVFPHWGNEYQDTPSIAQTEAAHLFADAGADIIVGAHPHVIQTYENYNGVPIIYSLGNFLFDQDWSVPTQQGLTLGVTIDTQFLTLTFVPVSVVHARTTVMNTADASTILSTHNLPIILKIPRVTTQNIPVQQ